MSLLIIDNYDSFTFNLVQCVEEAGVKDYLIVKNDWLSALPLSRFDRILISPGPGIASESGQLSNFIQKYYRQKSFLGICLGFEALLEFFGARLSLLPVPMHGIQNEGIILQDDYLFKGLPKNIRIGHYHSWFVREEDFPQETEILMKDSSGLIMAFRHKKYPLRALQFHPESYMTPFGSKIIANWLTTK